ncbi:hypothetical protein [Paracoccus laeviglucosivorans]|uniref:Uncharacterized protein n=1 Tax=Paracoccus laeviglucosivorans TaxID=1197861 RepID=A0A521EH02_9RHOB|nr:hypothetical protein [Paracoccus laeviglucosivorans]SMO83193.1 hypothetical protein SAMN06265221_11353 [Paracoccus laeviglucosivorans]
MAKHIIDSTHQTGQGRVENFTRQEREEGLHPAIVTLHSRPKDRGETDRRVTEFTRIERGRTT